MKKIDYLQIDARRYPPLGLNDLQVRLFLLAAAEKADLFPFAVTGLRMIFHGLEDRMLGDPGWM